MRCFKSLSIVAIVLAGLASSAVHAAPFDSKQVPADAKWVLHVDMDSVTGSQIWQALQKRLEKNPQYLIKIAEIQRIFAMQFPKDLHDATLFGRGFGEKEAVVLVHANVDQARVRTLLSMNPDFAATPHGAYEMLKWTDKGKTLFGSFIARDRFVVSQSDRSISDTLDTIDGKTAGLSPESTLAAPTQPGILLYIAADGMAQLANMAQSPLVGNVERGWITVGEQPATKPTDSARQLIIRAGLTATSDQTAVNVKNSLEGIKAMLTLAAGNNNPDIRVMAAAEVLAGMTTKIDGRVVTVDLPIPMPSATHFIETAEPKHATTSASTQPQ